MVKAKTFVKGMIVGALAVTMFAWIWQWLDIRGYTMTGQTQK